MSAELIPFEDFDVRSGIAKKELAKKRFDKYEKIKKSDRKMGAVGAPPPGPNSKHTDTPASTPNNIPSILIPKRKHLPL